jgi:hypothetical protein
MEARTDFQQAGHAAAKSNATLGRFRDPAQDLEQRALARPVPPNHADNFALLHRERHVAKRPEFFDLVPLDTHLAAQCPLRRLPNATRLPNNYVAQGRVPLTRTLMPDQVRLAQAVALNDRVSRHRRKSFAFLAARRPPPK